MYSVCPERETGTDDFSVAGKRALCAVCHTYSVTASFNNGEDQKKIDATENPTAKPFLRSQALKSLDRTMLKDNHGLLRISLNSVSLGLVESGSTIMENINGKHSTQQTDSQTMNDESHPEKKANGFPSNLRSTNNEDNVFLSNLNPFVRISLGSTSLCRSSVLNKDTINRNIPLHRYGILRHIPPSMILPSSAADRYEDVNPCERCEKCGTVIRESTEDTEGVQEYNILFKSLQQRLRIDVCDEDESHESIAVFSEEVICSHVLRIVHLKFDQPYELIFSFEFPARFCHDWEVTENQNKISPTSTARVSLASARENKLLLEYAKKTGLNIMKENLTKNMVFHSGQNSQQPGFFKTNRIYVAMTFCIDTKAIVDEKISVIAPLPYYVMEQFERMLTTGSGKKGVLPVEKFECSEKLHCAVNPSSGVEDIQANRLKTDATTEEKKKDLVENVIGPVQQDKISQASELFFFLQNRYSVSDILNYDNEQANRCLLGESKRFNKLGLRYTFVRTLSFMMFPFLAVFYHLYNLFLPKSLLNRIRLITIDLSALSSERRVSLFSILSEFISPPSFNASEQLHSLTMLCVDQALSGEFSHDSHSSFVDYKKLFEDGITLKNELNDLVQCFFGPVQDIYMWKSPKSSFVALMLLAYFYLSPACAVASVFAVLSAFCLFPKVIKMLPEAVVFPNVGFHKLETRNFFSAAKTTLCPEVIDSDEDVFSSPVDARESAASNGASIIKTVIQSAIPDYVHHFSHRAHRLITSIRRSLLNTPKNISRNRRYIGIGLLFMAGLFFFLPSLPYHLSFVLVFALLTRNTPSVERIYSLFGALLRYPHILKKRELFLEQLSINSFLEVSEIQNTANIVP